MAVDIDRLQIQIKADATTADKALGNLVDKISALGTALNGVPVSKLNSLSNAVGKLGTSMQVLNNIRTTSFEGLARKINSLGSIDSARLNQAANSIHRISNTLSNLGNVSQGAVQISEVAKNIAKLGGKNVTNAITNLPLLTRELNNMLTTLSRSPQVSRNIIDMTNALANLASQGRNISTVTNGMVNGLNRQSRAMNTARRSSFNLASAFGMLYAKYFLVMRAIKAFGKAITSTSDYIEAYNYYNVAFGKIADEWKHQYAEYGYANAEAYEDSFTQRMNESLSKMSGLKVSVGADGTGLLTTTGMKNLGLNIQEVTQYASQLASVTNSVGQTGEVSLIAADAFTKLGADISSLFNIDYASVMGNLQSGLIGQSRALYKYGIDITNATLQTYAYELGLSKAVSEMTQAEKMQLRMIAILDQSKVSWGDLANTINSPSNMLRQFKNNLSEVGNVLGQLFIPIMQNAMPVINGFTIALKDFLVNLASFMGIKLDLGAFGQGFADLEDETGGLSDNLDDIASSAKKATAGLRKFDELNNINMSDKNGDGAGALGSSIDLTEEISTAAEEYRKVWNEAYEKMTSKAQEFSNKIKKMFAPISEPLKRFFQHLSLGGWTQAGMYAGKFISSIFDSLSKGLEGKGDKIGGAIGKFLNGIQWEKVFSSAGNFFVKLVKEAVNAWKKSFDAAPIETAFFTALASLRFLGIGRILGSRIASQLRSRSFTSAITGALASMGGITGLLTTDFRTVMGAGTLREKGLWVGSAIIGGIISAIGGFALGQWISEWINGEEIDMSWAEQFDLIKESFSDGSWKEALKLWGNDIGIMFEDLGTRIGEWWDDIILDARISLNKMTDSAKDLEHFFSSGHTSSSGKTHGGGSVRRDVQTYATGGFPEDGLFYANHTELVGQFSNGRTAVANNAQIISGIEGGVERAVANVLAPYLAQIAQNTRETADKEFGITEKQIFDANRHQAQDYTRRTGRPAFS